MLVPKQDQTRNKYQEKSKLGVATRATLTVLINIRPHEYTAITYLACGGRGDLGGHLLRHTLQRKRYAHRVSTWLRRLRNATNLPLA